MLIGIDASRAFIKKRTGIEEYSYRVIKHLRGKLKNHQVILYTRHNQEVDFDLSARLDEASSKRAKEAGLPKNWRIKKLWAPCFWTQIRLSLEMIFNPVDILFIPAHTVPLIHPENTIVTIHGLEYEIFPKAYSVWERFYMRWSIRNSCRWTKKVIAVSQNTKKDLMKFYKTPEEKITVIYEAFSPFKKGGTEGGFEKLDNDKNPSLALPLKKGEKYLLFVGRLEKRKNIAGIVKAFEDLKENHSIPHKLVLAGGEGYGYKSIIYNVSCSKYKKDILFPGFVTDEEKWELLKNADVFLFPTLYEGFGIPILEAQSAGTPVVAGNNSSIPEVTNCHCEDSPAGENAAISTNTRSPHSFQSLAMTKNTKSALLVDPNSPEQIAEAAYRLISDETLKNDIINKGYENIKRFSWEKCASAIADIILMNTNGKNE